MNTLLLAVSVFAVGYFIGVVWMAYSTIASLARYNAFGTVDSGFRALSKAVIQATQILQSRRAV